MRSSVSRERTLFRSHVYLLLEIPELSQRNSLSALPVLIMDLLRGSVGLGMVLVDATHVQSPLT